MKDDREKVTKAQTQLLLGKGLGTKLINKILGVIFFQKSVWRVRWIYQKL